MLNFVAEQIDVVPNAVDSSAATERSHQHRSIECQDRLGLRPFGTRTAEMIKMRQAHIRAAEAAGGETGGN